MIVREVHRPPEFPDPFLLSYNALTSPRDNRFGEPSVSCPGVVCRAAHGICQVDTPKRRGVRLRSSLAEERVGLKLVPVSSLTQRHTKVERQRLCGSSGVVFNPSLPQTDLCHPAAPPEEGVGPDGESRRADRRRRVRSLVGSTSQGPLYSGYTRVRTSFPSTHVGPVCVYPGRPEGLSYRPPLASVGTSTVTQ